MADTAPGPAPTKPPTRHAMPFTRIELVVLTVVDGRLAVLLGRRAEAPHKGKWALPGGVLRIDRDRDLEAAAQRVSKERMGQPVPFLRQLLATGGPERDPRAPWALSIVYRALLPSDAFAPSPGKRLEALAWRLGRRRRGRPEACIRSRRPDSESPSTPRARRSIASTCRTASCPTASRWGNCRRVARRSWAGASTSRAFAGAWTSGELLAPVPGEMRTGAFRPAQLYRKR